MKKVLVLADYYWPGFKSGALRTVVNMVDRLGDRFEFHVITRNHDGGDPTPYTTVKANAWNSVGNARVYYGEPQKLTRSVLRKLVREVEPDVIYLNSCFARMSVKFLLLRRLGQVPRIPVVLAPEAELMPSNLALKGSKKKLYCAVAFPLGLYRNLIWKAASEPELRDIQSTIGADCDAHLAPNMPPKTILPDFEFSDKPEKQSGQMRLVFISRIMEKKNLTFALKVLAQAKGQIEFDIFGPIEDPAYWSECQALIERLPANVRANYRGAIEHEKVAPTLASYHYFFLPTLGENFGHVVIESLAAGTPALISDRTPWRELTVRRIGWDIALEDEAAWHAAIQRCVEMDGREFAEWSDASRSYAMDWLASPDLDASNFAVLDYAMRVKGNLVTKAA
jgi:glycosyltransferase involved in cell wall biosynthesis